MWNVKNAIECCSMGNDSTTSKSYIIYSIYIYYKIILRKLLLTQLCLIKKKITFLDIDHGIMYIFLHCSSNFLIALKTGLFQGNVSQHFRIRIGTGCALTMKKITNPENPGVLKSECLFFKRLLPSFCKSASPNLIYIFFIGYDFNDTFFIKEENQKTFFKTFDSIENRTCNGNSDVQLRFVRCNHNGQPAPAQNYALMAAYAARMDYLYMVNDDTVLKTRDWTPRFIEELAKFTPPNVGAAGPHHLGGNSGILTYNFVHRTHVDIFNTFYPRNFTDWYADNWISMVYLPNNVLKLSDIILIHTGELGTRYNVNLKAGVGAWRLVREYRVILRSYLEKRGIDWKQWTKAKKRNDKRP